MLTYQSNVEDTFPSPLRPSRSGDSCRHKTPKTSHFTSKLAPHHSVLLRSTSACASKREGKGMGGKVTLVR